MTGPTTSRPPGGLRATRQGVAVRTALGALGRFSSAQDLHARLRRGGERVGLTTVYRHLQMLADAGEVDRAGHRICAVVEEAFRVNAAG